MPITAPPTFNPAAYGIVLGAVGTVLTSTGATTAPTFQPAAGGAPGAPVNSIQFNNAGAFGGNAGLTYDPTTNIVVLGTSAVPGILRAPTVTNAAGVGITVRAGDGNGTNRVGGDVLIRAGDSTGPGAIAAGDVDITAGSGTAGSGVDGAVRLNIVGATFNISANDVGLTATVNTDSLIYNQNASAGNQAIASLVAFNDAFSGMHLAMSGTGNTNPYLSGSPLANTGYIFTDVAAAISLATNNVERLRIPATASEARLIFNATTGGADGKLYDFDATPTLFSLRTRTDADGAGVTILSATRTAASVNVTAITLGNATSNPTLTLAGSGNASFGAQVSATRFNVTGSTAPAAGIYASAANTVGIATSSTLRLSISTTAVTSTLPYIAPDGSAAAPSVVFTGSPTTGLFEQAANVLGIAINGAQAICINGVSATGAQTATFVATNKPGTGTAAPIEWLPVLTAGGTQGYIPIFGE